MQAYIYRPRKSAMQSGRAGTKNWILEIVGNDERSSDPLMGWTSSSDTSSQVTLIFDSKSHAEAYANRNGVAYQVIESKNRTRRRKLYAENFSPDRKVAWTH